MRKLNMALIAVATTMILAACEPTAKEEAAPAAEATEEAAAPAAEATPAAADAAKDGEAAAAPATGTEHTGGVKVTPADQ